MNVDIGNALCSIKIFIVFEIFGRHHEILNLPNLKILILVDLNDGITKPYHLPRSFDY